MIPPEEVTQRVIQAIARSQRSDPATIKPENTFQELGIDSLDGLNIVFELEEEFAIDIPDDAARQFTSVEQAVQGVIELLRHKPVPA